MAMASAFGGNAQNVTMLMRSDVGSSNSLVALLNPQLINFQGGLEDAIVGHKRPFQCHQPFDGEGEGEDGDGGDGETGGPVEKKRRLSFDQVRSLERNFEMENKLEPERKMQLAKELGLQPRQVAVWFQNRRARWKTKQLERDYEMLNSGYLKLKADFETALKEKDVLKAEIQRLSGGKGGNSATQSVESSEYESDQKQKEPTSTSSEGSRNSSSELLDADSPSPRTADSNHHHHLHEHEHEALPIQDPIYDFSAATAMAPPTTTTEDCCDVDEDAIIVAAAVKLEDDHATFFSLPPMVEPHSVLPWWDWA